MKISIALIATLIVAYIVGAKFPQLAQRVGIA